MNVQSVKVNHAMLSTFGEAELIIYLAVHAAKHHWRRIKWAVDFAVCVQRYKEIDWEQVLAQAASLHVQRQLLINFVLVHILWGIPYPDPVSRRLPSQPHLLTTAESILTYLLRTDLNAVPSTERLIARMQLWDHPSDRLRIFSTFILSKLKPGTQERQMVALPTIFSGFYYLLRVVRMGLVYTDQVRKLIKGILSR